jgi:hypothetical protein
LLRAGAVVSPQIAVATLKESAANIAYRNSPVFISKLGVGRLAIAGALRSAKGEMLKPVTSDNWQPR